MSPILGVVASSNQQGRSAGSTGAFYSLATVTTTSTTGNVTFTNIPQNYHELEIWYTALNNDSSNAGLGNVRVSGFFNGDTTAANYYNHYLLGDGNSAASGAENTAKFFGNTVRNNVTSPGINVINILDYNDPAKCPVVRTLTGFNNNNTEGGEQGIRFVSGMWNNAAAITSIQIIPESGLFKSGATFTLFGVE